MATGWKSSYFRYRELFLNVSSLYKKRADLRAFLEIILSITAVIVFSVFAIKPTALTIINLLQQIKLEKQTISDLNTKIANLEKANNILSQNSGSLDAINMAVASAPAPEIFTKQIQGLSYKNSVTLTGFSINEVVLVGTPKSGKTGKSLKQLPEKANEMEFSINIRGNYVNIDSFIKDLENLRVINTIDTLTISSSVNDSVRSITAIISGRVPYLGSEN